MSFGSGIGLAEEQRIMLAKYEIKNEYISDIGIRKEQWIDLLKDEEIIKPKDIELLKCVYNNSGFMATSPQLALLLNKNHYVLINEKIGKLGRRIASKLKIKAPKEPDCEEYKYWNIPFLGVATRKKGFYWILRPELKEAMEDLYEVPIEDGFISPDNKGL